ncbi:MAG: hypothetical protein ACYC6T_13185 [Thermoleophilia bacterium]
MNTRPESTRAALLQAAVAVIREAASPREVTIRKMADAANANLNAVNYHFGSKECLVREAVRVIIGDYFRTRGIAPGSSGPWVYSNLVRICDFLFDEPLAATMALTSELEAGGAGPSLTAETMDTLAALLCAADHELSDGDVRFRVWTIIAVAHQFLLRPEGCKEWLGVDPGHKAERDVLLAKLCAVVGIPMPIPVPTEET